MTTEQKIKEALGPLVAELKKEMYRPEYQATISDAECLGDIVSKFLGWDPEEITRCAMAAFEDANMKAEYNLLENLNS